MPGLAPAGEVLSCGDKKVPKETRPAAPALRATLAPDHQPGRPLNSLPPLRVVPPWLLRSNNAAGLPRSGSLPLGVAEGMVAFGHSRMAEDFLDYRSSTHQITCLINCTHPRMKAKCLHSAIQCGYVIEPTLGARLWTKAKFLPTVGN